MAEDNTLLTKRTTSVDDGEMEKDEILHMRLEGELKTGLDDLRRVEPDVPTRSEMVRRLIRRAMETQKRERKK